MGPDATSQILFPGSRIAHVGFEKYMHPEMKPWCMELDCDADGVTLEGCTIMLPRMSMCMSKQSLM